MEEKWGGYEENFKSGDDMEPHSQAMRRRFEKKTKSKKKDTF